MCVLDSLRQGHSVCLCHLWCLQQTFSQYKVVWHNCLVSDHDLYHEPRDIRCIFFKVPASGVMIMLSFKIMISILYSSREKLRVRRDCLLAKKAGSRFKA